VLEALYTQDRNNRAADSSQDLQETKGKPLLEDFREPGPKGKQGIEARATGKGGGLWTRGVLSLSAGQGGRPRRRMSARRAIKATESAEKSLFMLGKRLKVINFRKGDQVNRLLIRDS